MRLLALLPLAALAAGIPNPQPRETGRAPAHAPMARRAVTQQEARAAIEALAAAQAKARAEARADAIEARQDNGGGGGGGNQYEPLLHLASLAGIPLPTDPGALLGLAPEASKLLKALPTADVLTALETAAPSGFISKIVHDPSFAASFESAFAAGSSPSWFLALPTSVLHYLHTYNGIETVAGELGTVIASVTKAEESGALHNNSTTTKTSSEASQTGGIVVTDTATQSQSTSSIVSSASSAGNAANAMPTEGILGLSAAAAAIVLGAAAVM